LHKGSGGKRGQQKYAPANREDESERSEAANAAVLHDCEDLLAVPSSAKGIGCIGQTVFMHSAGYER
jgi:hypothetical protein